MVIEMPEVLAERRYGGFNVFDHGALKGLAYDQTVKIKFSVPRNAKFHRKFFAMLAVVFENQSIYTDLDHMRRDLIVAAGHVDTWQDWKGETQVKPKSIAFHKMSEREFDDLYRRILDFVWRKIIPNAPQDQIEIFENQMLEF